MKLTFVLLEFICLVIALIYAFKNDGNKNAIWITIATIIALIITSFFPSEKLLEIPIAISVKKPTAMPKPIFFIQTDEISDSWAEILAAIDDGTAEQRYAAGAWKPLDLGKYGVIDMQLAGFNLDERADGKGTAATTWIAKELLPGTHVMKEDWEDWSENGWERSDLRNWLQNVILKTFPNDLQNRLVSVQKQQLAFDKSRNEYTQTTRDTLWIPSLSEVFGKNSLYYGLFGDSVFKRVKERNGASAWWWLRSAYNYNSNGFDIVSSDGSSTYHSANYEGGVTLCFCL